MEPANLKQWLPISDDVPGMLFTCGRPGRATYGRERRLIDDVVIDLWVKGLPVGEPLHIVSLLGQKRDGFSEFAYYTFRSSTEVDVSKRTFEEWLNGRYDRAFVVHEFPTTDAQGIPEDQLRAVVSHVSQLLVAGETVLVIDSAGAERTARVCEELGWKRP